MNSGLTRAQQPQKLGHPVFQQTGKRKAGPQANSKYSIQRDNPAAAIVQSYAHMEMPHEHLKQNPYAFILKTQSPFRSLQMTTLPCFQGLIYASTEIHDCTMTSATTCYMVWLLPLSAASPT